MSVVVFKAVKDEIPERNRYEWKVQIVNSSLQYLWYVLSPASLPDSACNILQLLYLSDVAAIRAFFSLVYFPGLESGMLED